MSASGVTDICNLALHHLGIQPIGDISDGTPEANACQVYFNPCRDDVFSEHKWPFATAQISLQQLTATVKGWSYVYGYPVNIARVWNVYNEATACKKEQQEFDKVYIVDQQVIALVSNLPSALCDATYIVEDPTIWDSKFVMAFSRRLAAELAKSLTGDDQISTGQMTIYTGMINEAKRIGFNESKKKPEKVQGYRDARSGYTTSVSPSSTLDDAFNNP